MTAIDSGKTHKNKQNIPEGTGELPKQEDSDRVSTPGSKEELSVELLFV